MQCEEGAVVDEAARAVRLEHGCARVSTISLCSSFRKHDSWGICDLSKETVESAGSLQVVSIIMHLIDRSGHPGRTEEFHVQDRELTSTLHPLPCSVAKLIQDTFTWL